MCKMIEQGLIELLHPLLESHDKEISKKVCWILGNLAGEENQTLHSINIQKILNSNSVVTVAKHAGFEQGMDPCLRREALWCITNICT